MTVIIFIISSTLIYYLANRRREEIEKRFLQVTFMRPELMPIYRYLQAGSELGATIHDYDILVNKYQKQGAGWSNTSGKSSDG